MTAVEYRRFLARSAVASLSLVLIHGSASGDELVGPGRDGEELSQLRVPRFPGSGESIPLPRDLLTGIRMFREAIKTTTFNADTCASFLGEVYAKLFRASPSYFDLPEMKKHAEIIVGEIFGTKIDLRRQLARMESTGPVPVSCVNAMRDTMRASLFMSEYVAEHFIPSAPQDRVFSGTAPSLLVNPDFGARLALESGDVLMSRGDAFVSGAIARLGDTDGNFSHVALVYVEPRTREIHTVEAHIEIGACRKVPHRRKVPFRRPAPEGPEACRRSRPDHVRAGEEGVRGRQEPSV